MANPAIAYVYCAHCRRPATVHREARGQKALYYRCYEADGMSARCGTAQIRGPSGQQWIKDNWVDLREFGEAVNATEHAPAERATAGSDIEPKRAKRGLMRLLADDDDED